MSHTPPGEIKCRADGAELAPPFCPPLACRYLSKLNNARLEREADEANRKPAANANDPS